MASLWNHACTLGLWNMFKVEQYLICPGDRELPRQTFQPNRVFDDANCFMILFFFDSLPSDIMMAL